ncbi:Fe-S cluster assembly protein SufD [Luteimonas vadosa]|uniref:Fe-S cluster assembly protein SufD n=1 Tax=Luteimonas vadosa TaxID=1165507 RepID=A0ABP9DVZ9_9GAMM
MSALLDSLATAFDGDERRRPALDAALRDGLPGPRSEAWKYTSLRALERRAFAVPGEAVATFDASLVAGIPSPRIVFVNGRFDAAHSDIGGLPDGVTFVAAAAEQAVNGEGLPPAAVFARLNAALSREGVHLRAAAGTDCGLPVHLVSIGVGPGADVAWHLRHRIELEAGASISLVEHQLADGGHRHLENVVTTIRLGEDARLVHARHQSTADGATSFLHTDARLAASARYERLDLELGGALSRHELDVRLEGADSRVVANGVLLATGKRHVDTRLGIEHAATGTACELLWRGIGTDRGRVVFHGGITIHEGADGSDANLSNKNLLLGDGAEIDTQPVLVIHADEVKAAHGATVGQLDPTALFYLRTRGLPIDQARRLLTTAFVREPLAVVGEPAVREMLQARLDGTLQALVVR